MYRFDYLFEPVAGCEVDPRILVQLLPLVVAVSLPGFGWCAERVFVVVVVVDYYSSVGHETVLVEERYDDTRQSV